MGIRYQLVHSIPGRVRFHVPLVARPNAPVDQFTYWLSTSIANIDVRVNRRCASVIITFDPNWSELPAEIEKQFAQLDPESLKAAPPVPTAAIDDPDHTPPDTWWNSIICGEWRSLALATAGIAFSLFPGGLCATAAVGCSLTAALPSFQRAFCTIRDEHRLNVDFLDSLAIGVATAQGHLFTTAFMTWLLALGDWIRDQTGAKSRRAIIGLLDYQTRHAWVRRGDDRISIFVSDIKVGDISSPMTAT